ncbi:hypothetical protein GWK47_015174 [Chionoecetes opilio]|uniref:CCHC-type domain-containing protein n=1 Tax=Chionoecetes opilio TaxID=41210 RepID=A0A8J4XSL6_CHIOP|nr:hypothetical protein GWK47_015174 [Chionoecetes opilio]
MVCKDEVWLWFKDNEPHHRLELVCGLLNMCLPMELRFISTCLEDLGKRDAHDLKEAGDKANNMQEIKRLSSMLDERTRSNLIVYIALLRSWNHTCSTLLYQTLVEARHDPPLTDLNHVKEMLLIYTMVLHHPAFSFDQKRVIGDLHEGAIRLEAQLTQHQDLDTHLLEAFPSCAAAPEVVCGRVGRFVGVSGGFVACLAVLWRVWRFCGVSGGFVACWAVCGCVGLFCGVSGGFVACLAALWRVWRFCGVLGGLWVCLVVLWRVWRFCGVSGGFVACLAVLWRVWRFCGVSGGFGAFWAVCGCVGRFVGVLGGLRRVGRFVACWAVCGVLGGLWVCWAVCECVGRFVVCGVLGGLWGCDSGLSVGTEPEGDTLLEGCTLLPTPSSDLPYHPHTQGLQKSKLISYKSHLNRVLLVFSHRTHSSADVGGLGASQTSGEVALTPSYTYSHGNLHYYQYPPVVGNVSGCSQDGKGSNSDGSSSEDGPHNRGVQNGPPTSSPLSSPQSSPYVSPLQSLSPSRASSPLSRTAITTSTTTTTTAPTFPPTVTASTSSTTVPTNPGLGSHSSPRSGHKSPVGVTQTTVTHGGTHTGSSHRGKPPSSGVRSQRQSDRSVSQSRLPTGSSGDSESSLGHQTSQNSPTSMRGTTHAPPNTGNHAKNMSRWSGSHAATSTMSTSTSSCAAPVVSNNKNTTRQNTQSPCSPSSTVISSRNSSVTNSPVSKIATTGNFPGTTTAATITTTSTTITTTTLTTTAATPAAATTTTTGTNSAAITTTTAAAITATAATVRNTSPSVIVHVGNQDKHAHTNSINSSVRSLLSIVGSNSMNPSTLEKCPVDNNNCLNQDYIKHERLSKYSHQLAARPIDKLRKMSDREILELGLTKGALTKLRRVLATVENSSNHIPNGFTNHSVAAQHQCTSSHGSFSPSHAPSNSHPAVSNSAHSYNTPQTCSQNQHSTTKHQGKTGGTIISEASQNVSQKSRNSPSNTLAYCKESAGSHLSGTNNSTTGSLALLGSLSSVVPSATTLASNTTTTNTTIANIPTNTTLPPPTLNPVPASTNPSTTAAPTNTTVVTSNSVVNTASTNIASTLHATQCHSVTSSSSQKGSTVLSQQPPSVSTVNVETITPTTAVTTHGTHPPPVTIASQTRPSVLTPPASVFHYITPPNTQQYVTPPPPIPLKTTPPPTGLPQLPNTSQPPPNQHRTSPPSLCVPPRAPSQEQATPTTTSGLAVNSGSQQVYYNNGGPGGKTLPGVSSPMNPAASSMNVSCYAAPPTGNPPHSSSGGVAVPVYTSAGNMPVYTSSSGISVPPPSGGGLMPMMPHGGHYPATCTRFLEVPGATLTSLQGLMAFSSHIDTTSPMCLRWDPWHILKLPRNITERQCKAHGDGAELCEGGEHLGLLGSGASEEGTPPPIHHPPHPVLLPPHANLARHRGIPYSHLSYLGFQHSGAMRYPGPPLPNQGPIMSPRNPLPMNNDKSSRENTPPAPGALPMAPPDTHCCIRGPEGMAVPTSLAGNTHGRNVGSPHTPASHTEGPQPPVTHTPVPSVASAPAAQVPPGNSCTGAPHSSVQYNANAPGYQMVQVFPHFTGFMPTHSSLPNGFVQPPITPNFAIPNMGNGMNPEYVYNGGQYSMMGGSTQSGGGPSPACGAPAGMAAPTPGLGMAAGMPYTHYPPNLPHPPKPSACAKKSCYNCGKVGHHGSECKEANIEEMCNLPKAARS